MIRGGIGAAPRRARRRMPAKQTGGGSPGPGGSAVKGVGDEGEGEILNPSPGSGSGSGESARSLKSARELNMLDQMILEEFGGTQEIDGFAASLQKSLVTFYK